MSKTPFKFSKKKIVKNPDQLLSANPWHVLVVDDDAMVHEVTRLSLKDIAVDNRPISLHSCYSGSEASEYIAKHQDIALVLLDVVMETNDSGLRLVEYIRNDLQNHSIRIVLRTGQAGDAPEESVIRKYDINDYKEKTELTRTKLYTLLHSSLRGYKTFSAMHNQCKSMENILSASSSIINKNLHSAQLFIDELLTQAQLVFAKHDDETSGCVALLITNGSASLAASQGAMINISEQELLSNNKFITNYLDTRTVDNKATIVIENNRMIFEFTYNKNTHWVLYFQGVSMEQLGDQHLASIFAANSATALRNIELINEVENTQNEIVYVLGEAVESRSNETGNHVRRVCASSERLALLAGLEAAEARLVGKASALHDIGKIAIPDNILLKPGKLTAKEREVINTHAMIGYNILKSSSRPLINSGGIIALEHHEYWDGSGYPMGKKGLDIHIYGRIVAIIDVFDALSSKRCYKEVWPKEKVYAFMQEKKETMFDPHLVDLLLDNFDSFMQIMINYE